MSEPSGTTLDALRATWLFGACSDDELASIDNLGTELSIREGQTLMREGHAGLEFVILLDGHAVVTKDGSEIAAVGAGSFIGEMSLLEGTPRTATVTATSPGRALVFNVGEFDALLNRSEELRAKIERAAADRR